MDLPKMNLLFSRLSSAGILTNLHPAVQFNDEPHFQQWVCGNSSSIDCSDNNGVSIDFSKSRAKFKAIAESIERYFLHFPDNRKLIKGSYNSLGRECLDPVKISSLIYSTKLTSSFIRQLRKTELTWVPAKELHSNQEVLIPAQAVYSRYISPEPKLTIPISTGAAFGFDLETAIERGIMELIERDSFMRAWLTKSGIKKVASGNSNGAVVDYFNRYYLETSIFALDNQFGINTCLAFLLDRTGKGPAVSCGLSAGTNFIDCEKKALLEAQQVRSWIRYLNKTDRFFPIKRSNQVKDFQSRGFYWYPLDRIGSLDFLEDSLEISRRDLKNGRQPNSNLVDKVQELYVVDLVPEDFKVYGFNVVKCVAPTLLPLKISESLDYNPLSLGKLNTKLNSIPHPFL